VSESQPRWSARSPLQVQALRFGRSLIVGSGGTLLDLAAVTFSIRVLGLEPTWGRVVGLVVGCFAMFYGSRTFAFRAQSGSAVGQAKRFALSEVVGFPLNILLFQALQRVVPWAAPELLSLLANFLLFVSYYYPVRNFIVFRTKPPLVVQATPPSSQALPAAAARAVT
jgi:putative flippase GtrA